MRRCVACRRGEKTRSQSRENALAWSLLRLGLGLLLLLLGLLGLLDFSGSIELEIGFELCVPCAQVSINEY